MHTTSGFHIIIRLSLVLLLSFSVASAYGATYYVATTGNDSTGDGSIGNPWRTPVYGANNLGSGNTLYIRGGTYQITTTTDGKSAAIIPNADNTTISGYPGETAVLIGNSGIAPTNGVIGNYRTGVTRNSVTINNLTIKGIVIMEDGTNIVVSNCDISVGGDSWSGIGQGELIWVEACDNCVIRNNKLHDSSLNTPNGAIINNYTALNLLIENNEIYNSLYNNAINIKDTSVNAVVRYNYIHDNYVAGLWTANQGNTYKGYTHPEGLQIYQNIFANNNKSNNQDFAAITHWIKMTGLNIYNNTFYHNYQGDYGQQRSTSDTSGAFFNNISYNPRLSFINWPYSSSSFTLTYLDYNDYYTTGTFQWTYQGNHTSFNAWKTKAQSVLPGSESNSVISDPGFINSSGTLSLPSDFKRSAYTTNGRGGTYPSVMGAYITGNEVIGVSTATGNGLKLAPPTFIKATLITP